MIGWSRWFGIPNSVPDSIDDHSGTAFRGPSPPDLYEFLAYISHLFIDLFGPDKRPPYGIPLFWPLTDSTYLSPIQIFWGVHHAKSTSTSTTEWVTGIVDLYNVGAIGIEIAAVLPWILIVIYIQRKSQEGKSLSAGGGEVALDGRSDPPRPGSYRPDLISTCRDWLRPGPLRPTP